MDKDDDDDDDDVAISISGRNEVIITPSCMTIKLLGVKYSNAVSAAVRLLLKQRMLLLLRLLMK